MLIEKLLKESTTSADAVDGRPTLIGLTRAINDLLYSDLVAVQPTQQSQAVIYGLRYTDPNNVMTFGTPATYSGKYGSREGIEEITLSSNLVKGRAYKDSRDVVYVALNDINMSTAPGDNLVLKIQVQIMTAQLRIASEVMPVTYDTDVKICEPSFQLDLWKVDTGTRQFKAYFTHELAQDMNANGINSDNVIQDTLATTISEEINKDIMQTLQTVSQRFDTDLSPQGVVDMTTISDDPTAGRELYRHITTMATSIISDTSFEATWVLGSPRAIGFLDSSGWLRKDPNKPLAYGVLPNGLAVYVDAVTAYDYVIVGTNHRSGGIDDNSSSLFYAPYTEVDDAGAFKFMVEPNSLQPGVLCYARYALSVNPYTVSADPSSPVKGDDWNALAGKSLYSKYIGLMFP